MVFSREIKRKATIVGDPPKIDTPKLGVRVGTFQLSNELQRRGASDVIVKVSRLCSK